MKDAEMSLVSSEIRQVWPWMCGWFVADWNNHRYSPQKKNLSTSLESTGMRQVNLICLKILILIRKTGFIQLKKEIIVSGFLRYLGQQY